MRPVLGTMMPEICEAPHLLTSRFQSSFGSELNDGGGVHLIRSDAERQYRPEVVARTGFHEPARGLTRYFTGDRFRLLPDGFWCRNRRESDPAHYLRRYQDVFLSTSGTFQRPDITAIQRGGRPVNKAVRIK